MAIISADQRPRGSAHSFLAALEVVLERVRRGFGSESDALPPKAFLDTRQVIRSREGKGVVSIVERAGPADVAAVLSWYEPNTSDQPTYADDPKWKEWWRNALERKIPDLEVMKLTAPGQQQPLAFLALKEVQDWYDGNRPTLFLNGLRINPMLMPYDREKREFHGCGTALITFAVAESARRGLSGVVINSSLGVEDFYRSLGFTEIIAFDGQRRSFSLKNDSPRQQFMERQYRAALSALCGTRQ